MSTTSTQSFRLGLIYNIFCTSKSFVESFSTKNLLIFWDLYNLNYVHYKDAILRPYINT